MAAWTVSHDPAETPRAWARRGTTVRVVERSAEIEQVTTRLLRAMARADVDLDAVFDMFDHRAMGIGTDPEEFWPDPQAFAEVLRAQFEVVGSVSFEGDTIGYATETMGWSMTRAAARFGTGQVVEGIRISAVFVLVRGSWKLQHWHASVGVPNADVLSMQLPTSIDQVVKSVLDERPDLGRAGDRDVTLVFTDIESSTALAAAAGDEAWFAIVRAHDEELMACATRHRGVVVKTAGDGAMLAFYSPAHGLRFARELHATLRGHARLSGLRVRVGLHCGPVIRHDDDYYGTTVNLAARVAGAARGGEVLVSQALHDVVASDDAFVFDEPFAVTLKGFEAPHLVRSLR